MDEAHPMAKRLAQAGEWYVRAISNNDASRSKWLVLSGSVGCGKTHVARGIYQFVQSWGPFICSAHHATHWSSMWVDWPNVAEVDDESDFRDLHYEVARATFLVIDDLASESDRFKNSVSASRLRRILSLIENRWVVMTTNLTEPDLIAFYDLRVSDRLQTAQWLEVGETPSYRGKLGRRK